jgi:dienelactone hydrolase
MHGTLLHDLDGGKRRWFEPFLCKGYQKSVGQSFLIFAALLVLPLSKARAEEPYRTWPPPGNGPHPAVLFVPGCSGFTGKNGINVYDERASELQAAGHLVVYVDYIGRRMQTNCAHVLQDEVAQDILEAANWTRDQAGIDASRISVIGWSYGGGGVLAALQTAPSNAPTVAVLYYPVCRGAPPWSGSATGLMLLGAKDDIAIPTICERVAKDVPPERLHLIIYPDARHGFDMRGFPTDAPSGAPAYNAEATKASWAAVIHSSSEASHTMIGCGSLCQPSGKKDHINVLDLAPSWVEVPRWSGLPIQR